MATPATSTSTKKSKVRKSVVRGIVHINASFNNTIVAITDTNGDVIAQDSAGTVGFKGARKSTPFAASRASEKAVSKAKRMGLKEVEVRVKGPGPGRSEGALGTLRPGELQLLQRQG